MIAVDVFIPCYNYAHYLEQSVKSVLTQQGVDVRVLILDDASPDNTAEVADRLARSDYRVQYVRHSVNKGHIATYNEGISWVDAPYQLLLSADDYLLPGALLRAVTLLESNPSASFCYGSVIELHTDGSKCRQITGIEKFPSGGSVVIPGRKFIDLIRNYGVVSLVSTPTAVVRTAVQQRVGGYRPELPHSGDLELWIRLAANGHVGVIHEDQATYRRHSRNMSLGYLGDRQLADFEQRREAIVYALESCKHILQDSQVLRRSLFRALASDALQRASSAFNSGCRVQSDELACFALRIDPSSKATARWRTLQVKRWIGYRATHRMLPAIIALRSAAGRLLG